MADASSKVDVNNSQASVADEDNTTTIAYSPSKPNISHHASRNLEQFGQTNNIVFLDSHVLREAPACLQDAYNAPGFKGKFMRFYASYNFDEFLSRPVLHQWLQDGKIYREAKERQASRFELFFDLLFVGIVHQISDAAAELPTGAGLAKYVLTICPAYSIWTDVREIVNQFGTDDVLQRSYILWIMILLVGYSNNASSISVDSFETPQAAENVLVSLGDARQGAIRWALGFAAVAKGSRSFLVLLYCSFLQHTRRVLLLGALNSAFAALLLIIAIFVPFHAQITLVTVGIAFEYILKFGALAVIKVVEAASNCSASASRTATSIDEEQSVADTNEIISENITDDNEQVDSFVKTARKYTPQNPRVGEWIASTRRKSRIPAINIEHHVDRLGAFVTIVLGEMVANVFFKNGIAPGINAEAGRSFLALMLAFNLNWMYFGSEACGNFIHALRRHWITSGIFTLIHLPLTMALLLASSAVNQLVVNDDVVHGLKFFFGSGVGIGVLCMSIIGLLHKNVDERTQRQRQRKLDEKNKCLDSHHIPRRILRFEREHILGIRAVVGLGMIFLPFAGERLHSTNMLAIYVGITGFLIMEEVLARIERRTLTVNVREH